MRCPVAHDRQHENVVTCEGLRARPDLVLEHVTLELQAISGTPVGYGRAREANTRGVYKVVIEYREEAFGIECLHTAHRLITAAIQDTPFDIAAETKRLKKLLLDVQLGPSTRSIVEAAAARGIPSRRLTEGSLVRLGPHVAGRGRHPRSGRAAGK